MLHSLHLQPSHTPVQTANLGPPQISHHLWFQCWCTSASPIRTRPSRGELGSAVVTLRVQGCPRSPGDRLSGAGVSQECATHQAGWRECRVAAVQQPLPPTSSSQCGSSHATALMPRARARAYGLLSPGPAAWTLQPGPCGLGHAAWATQPVGPAAGPAVELQGLIRRAMPKTRCRRAGCWPLHVQTGRQSASAPPGKVGGVRKGQAGGEGVRSWAWPCAAASCACNCGHMQHEHATCDMQHEEHARAACCMLECI